MRNQPAVSVVVAVKNGAATLRSCLASIAGQADAHKELVVVDGASEDGSVGIIKEHASAYWCSEPDSGIYAAWNKALHHTRGDWVCFLGADDVFHDPYVLRDLLAHADARQAKIVYGKMNLVTSRGVVAQTVGEPWHEYRREFLGGFMLPHPGTLHHRSLFEKRGLFDESYRIAGDYELVLRELLTGEATFVDRVVVDMRIRGISARPETIHRALREVIRARQKHGLYRVPPRLRAALITSRLGAMVSSALGSSTFNVLADGYRLLRGRPRIWTV